MERNEKKQIDMTHLEIVKKIVGDIQPAAETHTDNKRFENLKEMCHLVNCLVGEIDNVAYDTQDRAEHSMKKMGQYASDFLTNELGITK